MARLFGCQSCYLGNQAATPAVAVLPGRGPKMFEKKFLRKISKN
jgi:hypothetical protein